MWTPGGVFGAVVAGTVDEEGWDAGWSAAGGGAAFGFGEFVAVLGSAGGGDRQGGELGFGGRRVVMAGRTSR